MAQTSIHAWAVPFAATEEARRVTEDARRVRLAARATAAAQLGLAWPRPPARRVGRPGRAAPYSDALHRAIEQIHNDKINPK